MDPAPYLVTFQGYPTYCDVGALTWKPLCADACAIEVTVPPVVYLRKDNGTIFHGIKLKESFNHLLQSSTAVMVRTSTEPGAAMYGFAFATDAVTNAFDDALKKLKEFYQQKSPVPQPRPREERPPVLSQNYVNTNINNNNNNSNSNSNSNTNNKDNTNPFKQRFPMETVLKENIPNAAAPMAGAPNATAPMVASPMATVPLASSPMATSPLKDISFKENVPFQETDQINEYISEHGNASQEQVDLCTALSKAVSSGHIEEAKQLVREMIVKKMKVKATPLRMRTTFDIKVYVEGRHLFHEEPITLKVDNADETTILDLKKQIYEKYNFPVSVQRFIIRQRLTREEETLEHCGIDANRNEKVYLYLKSLDDTDCTKQVQTEDLAFDENFHEQQQQQQQQFPGGNTANPVSHHQYPGSHHPKPFSPSQPGAGLPFQFPPQPAFVGNPRRSVPQPRYEEFPPRDPPFRSHFPRYFPPLPDFQYNSPVRGVVPQGGGGGMGGARTRAPLLPPLNTGLDVTDGTSALPPQPTHQNWMTGLPAQPGES